MNVSPVHPELTVWLVKLVAASFKSFLILALAGACHAALRRSSASTRHWLSALAITLALAIPLLAVVLPVWDFDMLASPSGWFGGSATSTTAPPDDSQGNWGLALFWSWAAASGLLLLRLLCGMAWVGKLTARAAPAPESWQRVAARLAKRAGIRRPIRLCFSDRLNVALSLGLWRPVVILPFAAREWAPEHLRSILLHELAHIRRWDNLINVLGQIACSIYWYNPLIWWMTKRLRVDRERACDNAVLEMGTKPSDYATHLLAFTRTLRPAARRYLWGSLEVGQSSALKDRLRAILDPGNDRRPLGVKAAAATGLIALLAIPLALFQPWLSQAPLNIRDRTAAADHGASKRASQSEAPQPNAAPPQTVAQTMPYAAYPSPGQARPSRFATLSPVTTDRLNRAASRWRIGESAARPTGSRQQRTDRSARSQEAGAGLPVAGPEFAVRLGGGFATRPQVGGGPPQTDVPRGDPVDPVQPGGTPGDSNPGPDDGNADPAPPVETRLVRKDLGTLGGTYSQALAVNGLGHVTGISTDASDHLRAFFWSDRTGMMPMGSLSDGQDLYCGIGCLPTTATRALGINDRGEAVGISSDGKGIPRAFYWSQQDGMIDIARGFEGESVAISINDLGQVAGTLFPADDDSHSRAFVWSKTGGWIDLGDPSVSTSAAGINDHGQVVGTYGFHAFIWTRELGMHVLETDTFFSEALGINNQGTVIGQAAFGTPFARAFRWDPLNGIQDLGTLGEAFQSSTALAVNDEEEIVGRSSSFDPTLGINTVVSFHWSANTTGMASIEPFGDDDSDSTKALSINNKGLVVGRRPSRRNGLIRGYVWTQAEGTMELSDPNLPLDFSWPLAINDDGDVAGMASYLEGEGQPLQLHASLWVATPITDLASENSDLGGLLDGLDQLQEQLAEERGAVQDEALEFAATRLTSARRRLQRGDIEGARHDLVRLHDYIRYSSRSTRGGKGLRGAHSFSAPGASTALDLIQGQIDSLSANP